ncbi:MAG: DUF3224 domain-containing protein [Holophagales bacterium]|jgi:hypothetical protein|nr:DUF3224 domain-containing protein [Holophagales bacterium]MBK9965578.1 DUF3224 domain-containing protein [Holophagales bacterium]
MPSLFPSLPLFLLAIAVGAGVASPSAAQTDSPAPPAARKEVPVNRRVTGTFEVVLTPQTTEAGPVVARMSIAKQFHGELEATSKGEMLASSSSVKGSAGYVAIEHVAGTLQGRQGTFVLQHTGTMTRGAPSLSVTVVPDSGTGKLTGLSGTMAIRIEAGKHFYDFEYSIAPAP